MKTKELKEMIKGLVGEDSILLERPEFLKETTFKRVKTKIEEGNIPFAMLTAFRAVDKELAPVEQDAQRADNNSNQREMKQRLKASGFPWVDMRGSGYKEGGPEGEVVEEDSVLVWQETRGDMPRGDIGLFETAQTLAFDYNQDSFLYGGPDPENPEVYTIRLYTNSGDPIKDVWAGGEAGFTELGVVDKAASEYWSMIGKKHTQFKEMYDKWNNFKPKSRLEAMEKQYYLKLAESKLKESE